MHYRGHGDARDLLPVPSRLKQQRVCSRGREQKSVMLEIKLPIKAYADATIAVEEDANYDFKTGPSFFKKKRCTRARLNPASAVTLYASYCIICLRITYSIDGYTLYWCMRKGDDGGKKTKQEKDDENSGH